MIKKIYSSCLMMLSLFVVLTTFTSCDDDNGVPVPFAIPLSVETTVPFASVTTTGYLTYPEIPLDLDVDAKIKEKYSSLSIDNLTSAKLESLEIVLKSSTLNGKLDAIKNARLYIKTPELEKKLVATVMNNTSTDKIVFATEDAELIEYLRSKKNSLIMEIQGQKLLADEFTLMINPSFKINVGL
ncbi:hypothetical protein OMO38_16220 [Chryseobacterium sp. 09-1422]|jgi:hypothetical protein|uniref:DUF4840 domain-containing protein n=1 Tax=Chryseobacterium kimseyorum TaxID=2984028 RepID=A0ABT3I1Z7_9FLAO|nr:hypothetical protein [Chryseobacterium kimseyorum]MCW3170072.1 hypothetical protein [Chryseobacterium kimseyorum]